MSSRLHLTTTLALLAAVPWGAAEDTPPAPPAPAAAQTLEERINELDQEIRILKRKSENADEANAAKAKTATSASASDKGFSLTSADKGFSLKIGAYAQADGRFFIGDDSEVLTERSNDVFLLRRARVVLSGNLAPWLEYRIMPDFAASTILTDAYLTATVAKPLSLTVGLQKPAVGLERLKSGTALTFLERGYPTNLVPNRDIGLQINGTISSFATWNLGVFNGVADGASTAIPAVDNNDRKDYVARLWLTPFASGINDWLKGLGFGVAASQGAGRFATVGAGLPTHRSIGQATIFTYAATVLVDGKENRIAPQLYWTAGGLSLLGEYTESTSRLSRGAVVKDVEISAYQAQLGFVLTGEEASWKGVKPKNAFAPGNGQWGAWELAGRITGIDFSDAKEPITGQAFGFSNGATSVDQATTIGVALNWYLTPNLKVQLDGELTQFDGGRTVALGSDRQDEQVISTRVQFAF